MGSLLSIIQDSLVVKRPPEQAIRTHSAHGTSLLVPKFRKCARESAFSVAAPRLWNSLPVSIRNASYLKSLKSIMIKDILISIIFYNSLLLFDMFFSWKLRSLCTVAFGKVALSNFVVFYQILLFLVIPFFFHYHVASLQFSVLSY